MEPITVDNVNPDDYDAIIAGAGAGGLLTSLALTAEGKRVLVIEKGAHLGGVWHSYWVDGYRVDQGLHVITRVKQGAFANFMRAHLDPPPEFVLHEGWFFRVYDKVGTIPTSVGETLRWPLTGMRGRLGLARIGAKIKTMKLEEMKKYKDITFLEFMQSRGATNQVMLDVMQSAIYMAAGVGIDRASAYESLRTLKDTDKERPKLQSIKNLFFSSEEYDEGIVVGGMGSLVQRVSNTINGSYILNTQVNEIEEHQGRVTSITVEDTKLKHSLIISNIPMWDMHKIVKSESQVVRAFFNKWKDMTHTTGLTLWLGLDDVVIGDRKSRVLVHPNPNRWMVSVSSFDPSCAPEGKELIGIATMRDDSISVNEQIEIIKSNGMDKYYPEILDHIEMEHVQVSYATRAALIPGQTDLDRPGPRTPVKGLYIVGTDTAGEGVGLQQAAKSAHGILEALKEDGL